MTTPVDVSHRQLERLHDDTRGLVDAFREADFEEAAFRGHLICLHARDMGLDELQGVAVRLVEALSGWRDAEAPRGRLLAVALMIEDVSKAMHQAVVSAVGSEDGDAAA